MASPALAVLAALASRRSRFFFRARAFLPYIALDEWIFLYACRARVVVWSIATVRFLAIKKNPNVEVASRQICAHVRLRHVPGSYRPLNFGVRGRDGHGD